MQTNEEYMLEVQGLSDEQIQSRIKMLENNIRILKNEDSHVMHEMAQIQVNINDSREKMERQKVLPYLVANVVEIIETTKDYDDDEGGAVSKTPQKIKCVIIKTTTRQVRELDADHLPASSRTRRHRRLEARRIDWC